MLKTFKQFIFSLSKVSEKKDESYEHGCAMVYFDFPQAAKIRDMIDPADVYYEEGDRSYGLEDEPHTTLLYGLHADVPDEIVMQKCTKGPIGPIRLHNASLFRNPKYDVLKFDAENPVLFDINQDLSELPHTTSFPDYKPHATIGYLKSGTGDKYVDLLKDVEYTVSPSEIVYSKPDGSRLTQPWN